MGSSCRNMPYATKMERKTPFETLYLESKKPIPRRCGPYSGSTTLPHDTNNKNDQQLSVQLHWEMSVAWSEFSWEPCVLLVGSSHLQLEQDMQPKKIIPIGSTRHLWRLLSKPSTVKRGRTWTWSSKIVANQKMYTFQKTHGSYSLGNLQPHSHWRKNIHVPIHGQSIVVIVCHQQCADTVIDGPITCIAQLYSNFDACPSQPADAFRKRRLTRMPRSAVYKHRTKPC